MYKRSYLNNISDCKTMASRSIKHIFRNVDTLIMTLVIPISILLVFTYLFGGAVNVGLDIKYINYVVPGILILSVGYSASTTSIGINSDFQKGIIDRFRSMPIARSSFLIGHIIAALIRNVITTILVIGFAFIIGFRTDASFNDWIIIIIILILFALMITSLAAMFGLLASSPDGAGVFGFVMMFLPYLTSAFVPLESMPKVLQKFSRYQPIGVVVDTIKHYLLDFEGGNITVSIIWCFSIALIAIVISTIIYMRKTTK